MTAPTTPAQHDAAATAIVTLDCMLREAVDRFGSVDAAAVTLIALMHEAVA